MLLLAGSIAESSAVRSCPRDALEFRRHLHDTGALVPDVSRLRFTRDVPVPNPSLAAGIVMGASKNGWDFWRSGSHSLDEAWDLDGDLDALVFYDSQSQMPPVIAGEYEAFSIPAVEANTKQQIIVARTDHLSVKLHPLPAGKYARFPVSVPTMYTCQSGSIIYIDNLLDSRLLGPSARVIPRVGSTFIVRPQVPSVLEEIALIPK